jgi:histone chaperone ASF1
MCLQKNQESLDSPSSGESHSPIIHPFQHTLTRTLFLLRDSEDSAPAEYPPEQPEADVLDDDSAAYGAEELELQAALERELADTEAKLAIASAEHPHPTDEDAEMAGTTDHHMEIEQPAASTKEDDEASDAGSEDLEAESSGSEDEDEEEDGEAEVEAEAEADEDMEMGDGDVEGEAKPAAAAASANGDRKPISQQGQAEVMVH